MPQAEVVNIPNLEARVEAARDLEFEGKYNECRTAVTGIADAIKFLEGRDRFLDDSESFSSEQNTLLRRVSADTYNLLGIAMRMLGDPREALAAYSVAGGYAVDGGQRAETAVNIADIHRLNKDFDVAHHVLDVALLEARGPLVPVGGGVFNITNPYAYIRALDQRGLVFIAEGKFVDAISAYEQANQLCRDFYGFDLHSREKSDRSKIKLRSNVKQHLAIAIEYAKRENRYEEAFHLLEHAIKLSEKIHDVSGVMNATTAAARLHQQCGDHRKALSLYKSAWQALAPTDYERGKAIVGLHRAIATMELDNQEELEATLDKDLTTEQAVLDAGRFADAVRSGVIPKGDYKVLAPYADRAHTLLVSCGVEAGQWLDVHTMLHAE